MTEGFFRIPAYQTNSARLVVDSLKAPVNMLWLHAQSVNNITGEPAPHATAWDELPGHHFLYKIGIQPQIEMVNGQKSWYPSFELDFTPTDFLTLHALLLKFKQIHQRYLDRHVTEASTTKLTELSGGLCFELDYALSKRPERANEDNLTPECRALKVFHMASGRH